MALPFGKLKPEALKELLARVPAQRNSRVVVGASFGEDAAVVRIGGKLVVVATDPVTFATEEIGHYAVTINANDVACMGARPRWLQVCILAPRMSMRKLTGIYDSILAACSALGVVVTGGHTEVTRGIDRPIVVATMMGEVESGKVVGSSGARRGDVLVMVKAAAIEGTAILAREKSAELTRRFGRAFVERCKGFLTDPGISVVKPALAAARAGAHALHDPTEGGILSGAYELASASSMGLQLDADAVPIFPETQMLADHYGLSALGLIASGSLLAAFDKRKAAGFIRSCRRFGGAWIIGEFRGDSRIVVKRSGKLCPLAPTGRDEILKVL